MNVLFDARYLNSPSSGIGVYCDNLLRSLLRVSPELKFGLVTRRAGLAANYDAARCADVLFRPAPRTFATLYAMPRWCHAARYDLLHSPFNLIPSGLKCRSIVTIHDVMQLQDPRNITVNGFVQHTAGLFWRTRLRHAAANATQIAAVSEATRGALLEYFPKLKPQHVAVTPNGVDRYFFEPPAEAEVAEVRRRVGKQRFVLCVGNESPHKNHARAIRSFLGAFGEDPSIRFVLVRRSVRRDPEMIQLLSRSGIAGRVLVLEHIDQPLLRALYSEASMLFFPSWVEGFGIPILEAMAAGTAVITSDRSAPKEVAGKAAVLVNPFDERAMANALVRVDEDAALRADLQTLGRQRAASFTWQRCAEATAAAYEQAMQAPRPFR